MSAIRRPCIDCRALTVRATRCPNCQRAWLRRRAQRPHYQGDYNTRAKIVRDIAAANPATQCWRCGRTLAQHPAGDKWQAGHLHDSDPTSPLLPEAASCNARAGGHMTNPPRRT